MNEMYKEVGIKLHLAYCKSSFIYLWLIIGLFYPFLYSLFVRINKVAYSDHLRRTRLTRNLTIRIFIQRFTMRLWAYCAKINLTFVWFQEESLQ